MTHGSKHGGQEAVFDLAVFAAVRDCPGKKNLSIIRECSGSMRESSSTPFNVCHIEMWRSHLDVFLSEETANT